MTIGEIQQLNCDMLIPTKWNIYEWAEKHPKTTIAAALKRVEKIFDFSDTIQFSFSGGKDSTVSANLAALELNLRKLRVKYNIMRDGTEGVDPLDAKWADKRLYGMMTDAEVCFSDTNSYSKRFLARLGPEGMFSFDSVEFAPHERVRIVGYRTFPLASEVWEAVQKGEEMIFKKDDGTDVLLTLENSHKTGGLDLIEFSWFCLPMAWQSGVSFDSGILISWDPEKKDMWVQEMPDRAALHGFEPICMETVAKANPIPMSLLNDDAKAFLVKKGLIFECKKADLFLPYQEMVEGEAETVIKAVGNYGRGDLLPNFKPACHEKEQQDDHSYTFGQSAWLKLSDEDGKRLPEVRKALEARYDLTKDVWFMKPVHLDDPDVPAWAQDVVTATALVSLRAEESLDRRVILSQGEYSTGQYSNNQGTNICSPVFDFTTADVWRLLAATDWDVNDVYQKLYEIGVGIGDQRVGSLLNYAAVRQVATVKALEPDLYGRINQRFSNVEFMANFSRSGYYRIAKPKDAHWDGKNHIKAGVSPEAVKALSDEYERLLVELGVPYRRDGNEFWTDDPACKGKPWFPLKEVCKRTESQ